jgi:hypothetical protein
MVHFSEKVTHRLSSSEPGDLRKLQAKPDSSLHNDFIQRGAICPLTAMVMTNSPIYPSRFKDFGDCLQFNT